MKDQNIEDIADVLCIPKTKTINEYQATRNFKVLAMAASQIGTLEWKSGSNPKVEEYLDYGSRVDNKDSGLRDEVPWCSGFCSWVLEKCSMGSTNSLMARSYEKWGVSSKLSPLPGDIVTFWRKSKASGFGHVGFFVGWKKPNQVLILGGNQNDSVNVTAYSTSRLVDIRRSSKAGPYSAEEIREIQKLAEAIKAGHKISPEGSVV